MCITCKVWAEHGAARQLSQGFGTSSGNEHMQVECYPAAPAERSAVPSLLNPEVERKKQLVKVEFENQS